MPNIARIRVTLSGLQGLPGVSTFYALDPVTAVPALRTFWAAVALKMPIAIRIQVEATGDLIDESTGKAVGSWSTTGVAVVSGGVSGAYAAPVGYAINWLTGVFIEGRKVRGRSFLVPIIGSSFESDGTPVFAHADGMRAAGDTMIGTVPANFLVYHRETAEGAADGTGVAMTSSVVNDKAAVLRSRRD